ncbi:AI-2E family transporter [Stomatohabitans albus]|uniref:AI-2E family transporter n=1 Tax=Stomatohabitans albus TaxID=3110766 RepID=UPI00300C1E32
MSSVPAPVIATTAWGLATIIIVYAARLIGEMLGETQLILIPMGIAILLAMLLYPLVDWLDTHLPKIPRMVHALIVVIGFIGATVWVFYFAGGELIESGQHFRSFLDQSTQIIYEWTDQLPIEINSDLLPQFQKEASSWLQSNWRGLSNNVVAIGSNVATMVAGTLLVIIGLLFFLADGKRIWRWVVRLLPKQAEEPTYQAFRRGAKTLSSYVQSLLLVAAFDAFFIGLGAFFLGLPLVVPITILVFIGAFIPILGATLTGMIAVLIALAVKGVTGALIMVAVVLATQQLEGNILQPLLLGSAVSIHPLAVLLVITFATAQFGIAGALFAVPIAALVNSVMRYYLGDDPFPELAEDRTKTLNAPITNA